MKLLILLAAIPLLQACDTMTPEERAAVLQLTTEIARDKLLDKPVKPQK